MSRSIQNSTAGRLLTSAIRSVTRPVAHPQSFRIAPSIQRLAAPRPFHTTPAALKKNKPEERKPADLNDLNVLGGAPVPATSVDVCMYEGFGLNSGVTIANGSGALLIDGEAFEWTPWEAMGHKNLKNKKGQFELPKEALAVFDVLWPRPDLLVIGTGKMNAPLSPATRQAIAAMGMRVEVLDTRNAAAQFNLLATERGVEDVAAALIPLGWQDGIGVDLSEEAA